MLQRFLGQAAKTIDQSYEENSLLFCISKHTEGANGIKNKR